MIAELIAFDTVDMYTNKDHKVSIPLHPIGSRD
jgi:hypothetical protein